MTQDFVEGGKKGKKMKELEIKKKKRRRRRGTKEIEEAGKKLK
jgi:hypothetical protein